MEAWQVFVYVHLFVILGAAGRQNSVGPAAFLLQKR